MYLYGTVVRRENGHVPRRAFDVEAQKKKGRPKGYGKIMLRNGFCREGVLCWLNLIVGINQIVARLG